MASNQPVENRQLAVRNLHLWRGDKHLLRGVSFEVRAGELLQVMGPNGVGKTSLLRCVAGLMPVESGEIEWRGSVCTHRFEALHQDLAYLAHLNALKGELTAAENLRYAVGLRRHVTTAEVATTLARLQIAHCADLPVRALSAGQKRRVSIARVLLTDALVWILDEPITNLDAAGIKLVEQLMAEHLVRGGLIVTAAHQTLLDGKSNVRMLELQ
jgi:heme exporter protein A